MSIVALFTVGQSWKQPKILSTDECINKMWNIHTVEFYPALKGDGILIHAITWMNLENIMLSGINQ